MFARFFIERPILANVIAYFVIIMGLVAVFELPVAQYPEITPPTVSVTTRLPGANAQTVAENVALPIEQQVNGVENMLYMQSTSANDGSYKLTVTFKVGTNLDIAQVMVQNRVATATPKLPPEVQSQGVVTKKVSTAILQVINLYSPDHRYDSLYMSNYAYINIRDVLLRTPGVGDVNVFGVGEYSMRIWLNPDRLKAFSLTPNDVISAVKQQNARVPAGQIGAPPAPDNQQFQYTVNVQGMLKDPEEFAEIVVKVNGSQLVRIKDIGRVELGAQTYSQSCTLNGGPSAGVAIYQLPGANAIDVANAVNETMRSLSKNFPQGLEYKTALDTTLFTQASINEVYRTLFEAAILVLIVILVFLQDWRAVLVPATTVPVTIIGAFVAMAGLGFSVNMVTLFALVLAIGIVVDDAIVIVEGAVHGIEQGASPKDATIKAMSELIGPVIGITLVLMAVFIPAAFIPGITGQLYNQFALVIASTALISALNAITLKPVQCSSYLKPRTGKTNAFYRWFNNVYQKFEDGYIGLVSWSLRHRNLMSGSYLVLIALTAFLFVTTPTGFIPDEDQGYAIVAVQLPDGASLMRTEALLKDVNKEIGAVAGIKDVITISGISILDNSSPLSNAAVIYAVYDNFEERVKKGETQEKILKEIHTRLYQIQGANIAAFAPPAIQGLGVASGFQMQLENKSGFNYAQLANAISLVSQAATSEPTIGALNTAFRNTMPQIDALIDGIKAQSLGVPMGDVYNAIQSYLGSVYINQFVKFGRIYQVYVQSDSDYRLAPDSIKDLSIRNSQGGMVTLGTLTDLRMSTAPGIVSLYNLYPSAALNGQAAQGFSSGQALKTMEDLAALHFPQDIGFEWTGISYQEKLVGNQALVVFALASLFVFLVLAAQYESWTNPAAVILVVPLALLGTMLSLICRGFDNNVYTQIGLVLLIALASKNAILIVEVARELHKEGHNLVDAATEASKRRLRPILMTSFAFILGVVPLVVAKGAGAASRQALGTAVFGGMIASTFLAIFFVPSFWMIMQSLSERKKNKEVTPAAK